MADISLVLDETKPRDLLWVNGQLVLTSDVDRRGSHPVLQNVVQRLRFVLGDFFLDTSLGLPYFQELFSRNTLTSDFEAKLQRCILETPGIIALLDWSSTFDAQSRVLSIAFIAQSTAGEISYNGPLVAVQGNSNV